jgi:tetratricopeptide (TPR) repeat protein
MVFVADDLVSWLLGQLADAARRRLTTFVLGDEQERALRSVVKAAVRLTAAQLYPEGGEQAERLEMVIGQAIEEPMPSTPLTGHATLLQAFQAGITMQLAPLGDPDLTGTGRSSAELLGVQTATVAEQLAGHLLREIIVRGAHGGPLAPLASQLNHDATHLQGQRVEEMLGRLADTLMRAATGEVSGQRMEVPTAARTLPADVASFSGRQAELEWVVHALSEPAGRGVVGIDAIDGMAGVGKTAFAVHAAHLLAPRFPDGQLFVQLHGHTSGHDPAEPADALATLLLTIGVTPQQVPAGLEARAALWRDLMAGRRVLLLLDDATGSEQIRPLLPGTAGTLVLVTSRRRLTGLAEALPVTLDVLAAGEAAKLFVRLVGRPSLLPTDPVVAEVVALCGYLPLAISLVAGQFKHRATWKVADLAAELGSAAGPMTTMAAENESVTASFGLSYGNLSADQQRLFRQLGLHPGTDIDAYAASALGDTHLAAARQLLDQLFDYHLIEEPAKGRYRLHDLIREHARALAAADPPAEQDAATGRLLDYYLHASRSADHLLARNTPARVHVVIGTPPACTPELSTRAKALAWMEAERLNLHAAVSCALLRGRPGHATAIPAAMHSFLRRGGHWDQALALHRTALTTARDINDQLAEADALNDLGDMQYLADDYPAATTSLSQALDLYRHLGNRLGAAHALSRMGTVQIMSGDYPAATTSLTQALDLYRDLGNRLGEASTRMYLGEVQRVTGDYPAAAASLTQALDLYHDAGDQAGAADVYICLGAVQDETGNYPAATASLTQALDLYRKLGDRHGEASTLMYLGEAQKETGNYPAATTSLTQALDQYRNVGDRLGEAGALTFLGAVQTETGNCPAAAVSLTQALNLYRALGVRLGQGNAIFYMGALQTKTRDYPAATASLTQALDLYRLLGNRLGEAEALNNLGELWLASLSHDKARAYYEKALAIATDIASPSAEASALEGLGRCFLTAGRPSKAAPPLHRALAIYQRIGSPHAQRVETFLHDHDL